MFSRLRDVSLTSSVLVRTSIATLPRSESRAALEPDAAAAAARPAPCAAAAGRAAAANQRREVGSLRVVHLDELGADRLERLQRLLRLEVGLLARRDFLGRRDDDHVAVAAHVETLGRHHDVERLVPRHVLQAQRDAAHDRVADHDVEAAEVGDELEHRARLEVLEVQREPVARVLAVLVVNARGRRGGLRRRRLELESEQVVGLVRDLVVLGRGAHDEPRVAIRAQRVDRVSTGVAKSVTSSRFMRSFGIAVSWKSTTTRPPSSRTSTVVCGSLSSTTT